MKQQILHVVRILLLVLVPFLLPFSILLTIQNALITTAYQVHSRKIKPNKPNRIGDSNLFILKVAPNGDDDSAFDSLQRRIFLGTASFAGNGAASMLLSSKGMRSTSASAVETKKLSIAKEEKAIFDFQAYEVIPDPSKALAPSLVSIQNDSFLKRIASSTNGGALWLGEHHNSASDHSLQLELIQQIISMRNEQPTAVGLEQVQIQFQPALDQFISKQISLAELRKQVQWDQRWGWSFELYEPIFRMAQQFKIPLIALNVNSEDLALVEKDGLPGLSREVLHRYILDAPGFAAFATREQYRAYVDYVIRPSYQLHRSIGLLEHTMAGEKLDSPMSFRNFFSGRILWDESMATNAYLWNVQNPGGLLIGLVGADHVKFFNGIPGRYSRYTSDPPHACVSVLLNPTLVDTRPIGSIDRSAIFKSSEQLDLITLQLRYVKDEVALDPSLEKQFLPESTGGVLALADYIIVG